MKKFILAIIVCFIFQTLPAQSILNMELVANVSYNEDCNDIWGFVDPNGIEYAILGLRTATAVLSLEDPANPQQLAYIEGSSSTWRDMKHWGDFVYVTTDDGDDGLLIIDMSEAPTTITSRYWKPELTVNGETDSLERCHNLYIDENGYCYISGSRELNGGGVIIFDVHSTPGQPIYVGAADNRYSHDNFVRGDTLWSADINAGFFSVTDVSDKTNPVTLAVQPTSFVFTHNIWMSDDGKYAFTTDEKKHAFVDAFDVTDLGNIKKIDSYRPKDTEGTGVIPHNTHYYNGYLVTSWYTDGIKIIDAHKPDNLVEVGNYDTNTDYTTGFHGCWGAYPFLPSGLMLASDIENGLFVFRPNLVRACYLEGKATDAVNLFPVSNVNVTIQSTFVNEAFSDLMGDYKTGLAQPGMYMATYSKSGYEPQTLPVTLVAGEITTQDVQLQPIAAFEGRVIRSSDGAAVEDAQVVIFNDNEELMFTASSDQAGNFKMPAFEPETYTVVGGKWGYLHQAFDRQIDANNSVTIVLDEGYQDDFILDQSWTVGGDGVAGVWERTDPTGTFGNIQGEATMINPEDDVDNDLGRLCYVTGNARGFISSPGDDDVDNGAVTLTCPSMDLSDYLSPIVEYNAWFVSGLGNRELNDSMKVYASNGTDTVLIETVTRPNVSEWRERSSIRLAEFLTVTNNMQIIFSTIDDPAGHWVEAGVDAFLVVDAMPNPVAKVFSDQIKLSAFPNPFAEELSVQYQLDDIDDVQLSLYNLLGQRISTTSLQQSEGTLSIGNQLDKGIYFIHLETAGKSLKVIKIVKQ